MDKDTIYFLIESFLSIWILAVLLGVSRKDSTILRYLDSFVGIVCGGVIPLFVVANGQPVGFGSFFGLLSMAGIMFLIHSRGAAKAHHNTQAQTKNTVKKNNKNGNKNGNGRKAPAR